jgi:hypothetical protein
LEDSPNPVPVPFPPSPPFFPQVQLLHQPPWPLERLLPVRLLLALGAHPHQMGHDLSHSRSLAAPGGCLLHQASLLRHLHHHRQRRPTRRLPSASVSSTPAVSGPPPMAPRPRGPPEPPSLQLHQHRHPRATKLNRFHRPPGPCRFRPSPTSMP